MSYIYIYVCVNVSPKVVPKRTLLIPRERGGNRSKPRGFCMISPKGSGLSMGPVQKIKGIGISMLHDYNTFVYTLISRF